MTYNILLVDDEIHAIEGVKSDLDLVKLRISQLYTAFNIRQAKEVFEGTRIDIMLCDIEMPQGNGLELLMWVKENYPNTATIFLTSHADFKYAKEALKLGSLDYLLKPVFPSELEDAVRKAQSIIDRNSENKRNSQSHQMWLKHHSLIIERFWLDLINHSTPSHPNAIREQVERHHIPITDESVFLPLLISVQRWNKELKRRDERVLEYALKNAAEEVILKQGMNGLCFQLDRGMLMIVLVAVKGTPWDDHQLQEACEQYINFCNQYIYCDLSCYFGRVVEAYEMAGMVAELRSSDRNNVVFVNQVFPYHDKCYSQERLELPALSNVSSLLKNGTKEAVILQVEEYLADLIRKEGIDADTLHRFNQDFMQVLYTYLHSKGVIANQLFGDEESRGLSESAGRSVTAMSRWVLHAVNRAMVQVETITETDSVVQTIKRYIALNMDQDLSRETIAEQVYMNPDYMSRIFKKDTGYSLSDYVILERINQAKELLSQTKISISSIATSVGYNNFSHFAKIFKKYVGTGPTEYRSQFSTIMKS